METQLNEDIIKDKAIIYTYKVAGSSIDRDQIIKAYIEGAKWAIQTINQKN